MVRIGIDVGGTFTDVVLVHAGTGAVHVAKVLNEPGRRHATVARGISLVMEQAGISASDVSFIGHGTTITTNAVIERKGARIALITNKGFRDVIEIGRFSRPADLIYRSTPRVRCSKISTKPISIASSQRCAQAK